MAIPGHTLVPRRPRMLAGIAATFAGFSLLLALFAIVATLLVDQDSLQSIGRQSLAAAILLGAIGAGLGIRNEAGRRAGEVVVGGVRALTVVLRLGGVACVALLFVAIAQHMQRLGLPDSLRITEFAAAGAVAVLLNIAHLLALAEPPARGRTFVTRLIALVGLLVSGVFSLIAWLAYRGESSIGSLDRSGGGPATLLLAAAVAQAFAMMAAQGLPTARDILVKSTQEALPGGQPRTVVLPLIIAFALLILSLLLFLLFGVGVVGVLEEVVNSPVILVTFAVLMVVVGLSVYAAFRLANPDEEEQVLLYRPATDPRAILERRVLLGSLAVSGILIVGAVGAYTGRLPIPQVAWLHLATFGLLAGLGPYGFLVAREHDRIRRLEERFPDFLREMASSHKGGLTLAESLRISARSDYGPLTDEVKRMADQVAWNVPFTEALQRFSDRVQTPLVQRAVNLVLEADRSGGASTDVLLAAARDAREIKTLENERRISMSLYTIVIYITFLVFLGVAAVLYSQFVPQLVAGAEASKQAATTTGGTAGLSGESLKVEQFQLFYFLAALVQALGDGIVAGQMGTGKAKLGLRHSFIMVLITYVTFALFVQ